MMTVALHSVGLYAPGLPNWQSAIPVLRGELPPGTEAAPAVTLPLPSAERRRTSACARAAWAAAEQALGESGFAASDVNTVFTSSGGDGVILDQLCTALATPERAVSPTQFHNSVHNAPAGYFSIAHASHAPTTSVCHHRSPFTVGLLEAAVQVCAEQRPVLLVGFDLNAPLPLAPLWPAQRDFAVALLLAPPSPQQAPNHYRIALTNTPRSPTVAPDWIAALVEANPMAESLHWLAALASNSPFHHHFSCGDDLTLEVECTR